MTRQREQGLHEGRRFPIRYPDGHVEYLTAKEYLAHRARFNDAFPLTREPTPGAGSRRTRNPRGYTLAREA
ncbi:MAG: hypothetical protein D6729_17105 [Deltaproteobacteria bacterium]|nr:MAG: hypothetical protein D6729_17105 [Deltaproteobacteria bacterium]